MGKTPATVYKLKLISERRIVTHINCNKWRRFVLSRPAAQGEVPSLNCPGILEQSMGARNRVGMDCRTGPPAYIGWRNRFLGSLKV